MRLGFDRLLRGVAVASLALACEERAAPPPPVRTHEPAPPEHAERSTDKPSFVPGEIPIAPFVAEELAKSPANGVTLVYAGAKWCEPCQRFHRALEAGELDERLKGFRFVDYDLDTAQDALVAAGYGAKLIPLFALPKSDGTGSGRQIEGGVKGDGAVAYILPRLLELARRNPPPADSRN